MDEPTAQRGTRSAVGERDAARRALCELHTLLTSGHEHSCYKDDCNGPCQVCDIMTRGLGEP